MTMDRTIGLQIDRSTWPQKPQLPRFPAALKGHGKQITVNIPSVLLQIGYLTTPPSSTGVSLSEYWAWIRYLSALTVHSDLRITPDFENLDSHQKTILSDDFGMGVPMLWLTQKLDFRRVCDGRYFLRRYAASANAVAHRTAKRGPNKTPDFVARDGKGIWHIVECKGTQSGRKYRDDQIGEPGLFPTGGIAQKMAIEFPAGYAGQRLVTGLSIAGSDAGQKTHLRIVDPELEEPEVITEDGIIFANDAADRAMLAKFLRMAGFSATAEATAAPSGSTVDSKPYTIARFEAARRGVIEDKEAAAREELAELDERRILDGDGNAYIGRTIAIDLPKPIIIGDRRYSHVTVSQGVNKEILKEMAERPLFDQPLEEIQVNWKKAGGKTTVSIDDRHAVMTIGDVFRSTLTIS